MDSTLKTHPVKVVLVGRFGVGKSSIIEQYCHEVFKTNRPQTISVDFEHKEIKMESNEKIDLQIWDTAGQEKYKAYLKVYCQGVKAVI